MARTWKDIKINEQFKAGTKRLLKVNDLEYIDVDNPILGETIINPLVESQIDQEVIPSKDDEFETDPQTRVQRRKPASTTKVINPKPKTTDVDTSARIIPPTSVIPATPAAVPAKVKAKPGPKPGAKSNPKKAEQVRELRQKLAIEQTILKATQKNITKLEKQLKRL